MTKVPTGAGVNLAVSSLGREPSFLRTAARLAKCIHPNPRFCAQPFKPYTQRVMQVQLLLKASLPSWPNGKALGFGPICGLITRAYFSAPPRLCAKRTTISASNRRSHTCNPEAAGSNPAPPTLSGDSSTVEHLAINQKDNGFTTRTWKPFRAAAPCAKRFTFSAPNRRSPTRKGTRGRRFDSCSPDQTGR